MKRGKLKRKLPVAPVAPAEDRPVIVPLTVRWHAPGERWFTAVHEGGFACSQDAAEAIRAAQESVSFEAPPGQLLLYVADTKMEPTGFVTWANGAAPRLVGLTNTHQGFERRQE